MQGLTVHTAQFGDLPWFGAALSSLSPEDRQAVYAAKHAVGDTHCIVDISWNYAEPGQPYGTGNRVPPTDLSGNLPAFRALVLEIIRNNFIPMVFLAGDGDGDGIRYNDPVGWTYGHLWLMNHLGAIVQMMAQPPDLTPYIVWSPGFDGVFYGWEPSNDKIPLFGLLFRRLLPNGYLAIEHNTGHIPLGNGPVDYEHLMTPYDVILTEFDPVNIHADSTWQIAARLLGPLYHRPLDQPAGDDPRPPNYLAAGTPRGRYFTSAFEVSTFVWVRGLISVEEHRNRMIYLRNLGYPDAHWAH